MEEERQQLQLADGRAGFGDGVQPKGGKKWGGGQQRGREMVQTRRKHVSS